MREKVTTWGRKGKKSPEKLTKSFMDDHRMTEGNKMAKAFVLMLQKSQDKSFALFSINKRNLYEKTPLRGYLESIFITFSLFYHLFHQYFVDFSFNIFFVNFDLM